MIGHEIKAIENGGVCTPAGFMAAGVKAGLKASGNPDLAVLLCTRPAPFAAAFTQNAFAAAPVHYSRRLAAEVDTIRACVINAGNANCCTGRQGVTDAGNMAGEVADCLGLSPDEVLVFSTGRIGVMLPMDKVTEGIRMACEVLSVDGGEAAANAIMTTDTVPKSLAVEIHIDGVPIHVGGMAKGVGMIDPNLAPVERGKHATMLAFITTDAKLAPGLLDTTLAGSLDHSFNRVTVDGDTSTNDSFIAMASNLADIPAIRPGTVEAELFQRAFDHVAGELAKWLVKDGEGATRFVELRVTGARTPEDAKRCAKTIANSLLCKTAWFGADPNYGRILDAAGYSGVTIEPTEVSLYFEGEPVVRGGAPVDRPEEELAQAVDVKELHIDLDLGLGDCEFTCWTCDLSYEYVKINAEYHT